MAEQGVVVKVAVKWASGVGIFLEYLPLTNCMEFDNIHASMYVKKYKGGAACAVQKRKLLVHAKRSSRLP